MIKFVDCLSAFEMKKAFAYILMAFMALNILTGCDFLRAVAGRPSSSDLALMREQIEEEKMAEEAAAKAAADSVAQEVQVVEETPVKTAVKTPEFVVVVGSFGDEENADRYVKRLVENGFAARKTIFKGMTTVVVDGPEGADANAYCEQIRSNPLFPKDSWPYYPKNQ